MRFTRRPSALSSSGASSATTTTDGQPSASAAGGWPKDFGSTPRDAKTSSRSSKSSSSSANNGDADIVIEEKRRRAHGEGYSVHRYLRGRMLGKGGFAKVYLCTALDTNKNYAVKIVPKANLVKARARQKVRRMWNE